jgi:hypothetical protein
MPSGAGPGAGPGFATVARNPSAGGVVSTIGSGLFDLENSSTPPVTPITADMAMIETLSHFRLPM